MNHYEKMNQRYWDAVTPVHVKSYGTHYVGVEEFLGGQCTLYPEELDDIGEVWGKSLLHLQCHFGLDTLSWARRGAQVTGVDFSGASIEEAQRIRNQAGLEARFIQCNLYDLPEHHDRQHDIVYTSRGAIMWLKDIREWARLIYRYLRPGGLFYMMEVHPFLYMLDNNPDDPAKHPVFKYPYFHQSEPQVWADDDDYADESFNPDLEAAEWVWPISDVINALVEAGLQITGMREYDRIFYPALKGLENCGQGWWRPNDPDLQLPLTYSIMATSPL